MTNLACWNCGANLAALPQPISRHIQCPSCFEDLHCCRLCIHYDPKNATRCADDRAEPPIQKTNANFCEFWLADSNAFKPSERTSSGDAKAALDALFGTQEVAAESGGNDNADEPSEQPLSVEESVKAKLQALFNTPDKKP